MIEQTQHDISFDELSLAEWRLLAAVLDGDTSASDQDLVRIIKESQPSGPTRSEVRTLAEGQSAKGPPEDISEF